MPKDLWQCSLNELSQIEAKGVERKRKKRNTKTELVAQFLSKGEKVPEYNTSVTYEPKKESVYEIVSVD